MAGLQGTKPTTPGPHVNEDKPTGFGNPFIALSRKQAAGKPASDGFEETRRSAAEPQTANPDGLTKPELKQTHSPKNNSIVGGLSKFWNYNFKISEGKNDFFYWPKTVFNKVWTYKPVWLPLGTAGGAIAAGVIFGVIHKAVILGALGAFFSSHVGWAVAAAIGGVLIVLGLVTLYNYVQHLNDKDLSAAKQKEFRYKDTINKLYTDVQNLKKAQSENEMFEAGRQKGHDQARIWQERQKEAANGRAEKQQEGVPEGEGTFAGWGFNPGA